MKNIILTVLAIIVLVGAGMAAYVYYGGGSPYQLTLDSELNYSDRHFENITSERAQQYTDNSGNFYLNIGTFPDKETAMREISRLVEQYNPGQINYGKYVYYDEKTGVFFYRSANKIVLVTSSGHPKDVMDTFIMWFITKVNPD